MEWIRQLQEALSYIEKHLPDHIGYDEAVQHVYMSGYSFHRAFSLMAGMTVTEYIRLRRLSLAAQELRATDISVLDAALKYGYETPESFSKAFARFHGVTPRQAKLPGTPLRMFNPLNIRVSPEGGTIMEYRMGMEKALVTVHNTNPASIRVALRNSGVIERVTDMHHLIWVDCRKEEKNDSVCYAQ